MDYANMTKDQLLVEFRALRNTLKKLDHDKMELVKHIAKTYGSEHQKDWAGMTSDSSVFELLLSGEME
ncbi:MAG: hypothetical protein IMZ53_00420 [Thermoplasmata archaeon]|nr:hypothetical protein [Thermoplasmata archaeon]